MGHKKKDGRNSRTLHQQAYDKLQKMQAFGDSKRLDKLENPEDFARKIYSFSTYQTYFKHIKYFIKMDGMKIFCILFILGVQIFGFIQHE